MKKKKKSKYIVIVVIIGLIALFAWYLSKDNKPKTNQISKQEEEEQIEQFNLRIAISNVDTLNPIVSKNRNIQEISKLIYEPLFNVTDTFKLENALAIEGSRAEDNSYFIKLRENTKWQNGTEFTSEDVKFTIDWIKALGEKSIYIENVSNIENVEILSENLIKLKLKEVKPFFEYNLTFPIISKALFEGENIEQTDKNNLPIGTRKI